REIAIAEFEALGQLVSIPSGNRPFSDSLQESQQFVSCQIGVDSHFARQVSNRGAGFQTIRLAIVPEDGSIARCGAQQVEQDPDGGSLAGAVQPEKSKNLATRDFQIKMIYRNEFAVPFRQSTN